MASRRSDEDHRTMASKSALKGCLIAFGAALLVVGITVAVGVGIGVAKYRHLRDRYTDPQPVPVEVASASEAQARRLQRKADDIRQAVERGIEGTFFLNGAELNQMVAVLPRLKELKGRVALRIDGNAIKATTSVPLDQLPGMAGRYLNGDLTVAVACRDGHLEIYAQEVLVRGEAVPESFMSRIRSRNLAEDINRDPDVVEKLRNIESLRVEDGQVVIQTRQRQ